MWSRVFADLDSAPEPSAIAGQLQRLGYVADAQAEIDELGWFHLELATNLGHLTLDRYGADEGIRADLNSWAAWLEIHSGDHAEPLMQRMIGTRQIITLRCLEEPDSELRQLLHGLLAFLAEKTSGIYQVDGEGFFDAHGRLLVPEAAGQ